MNCPHLFYVSSTAILFLLLGLASAQYNGIHAEPSAQQQSSPLTKSWTFLGLSHLYDYATSWLGATHLMGGRRLPRSNFHRNHQQRSGPYAAQLRSAAASPSSTSSSPSFGRRRRPTSFSNQLQYLSAAGGNATFDGTAARAVAKSLHYIPTGRFHHTSQQQQPSSVENNNGEAPVLHMLPPKIDYDDEYGTDNGGGGGGGENDDEFDEAIFLEDDNSAAAAADGSSNSGGQWPSMTTSASTGAPAAAGAASADEQQQQSMIDNSLRQVDHMRLCEAFLGSVPRQLELCRANAEIFWRIREAAQMAVTECKRQFQNERWNCSTSDPARLFGQTLKRASKEEAFVSAVSSAAVVYSVVKACSSGNLSFCSCDNRRQGGGGSGGGEGALMPIGKDWRWGGCSDDLRIGEAFAEAFVDAPQKAQARSTKMLDIYSQIDLHNNAAGRMIIKQNMQRQCRCHGLSGSCEMRTCWEQMPSFKQIGRLLKNKYDKSVRVGKRFKKKLRRRGRGAERLKAIAEAELVYLRRSPNYCEADPKRGIFGTQGRVCNRTSTGPDSCDQLCCGRGYATRVEKRIHRCDCKFVWCCEVRCKTCMTETEVFVCM